MSDTAVAPVAQAGPAPAAHPGVATRPTQRMSWRELFQISVYWLALNATWGGMDIVVTPSRMTDLVCRGLEGEACVGHEQAILAGIVVSKEVATAIIALAGALVALAVQPIAAAASDYTRSRWGRRKPYIFVGTVLDVLFLAGIAMSNTFLAVFAFIALLQFSANLAQGPFQAYVPDLVPTTQVGIASGLMGVMIITGNLVGIGAAGLAIALGDFRWGLAAIAVLELSTMIATVLTVREPPGVAPPRQSRSLGESIRSTARAVLSHRSFMWLLGSRCFFLVAVSLLTRMALFYMRDSIGLTPGEAALAVVIASVLVGVMNGAAAFPSALLSDRLGRKAMIYAACAIGLVGMLPLVVAQHDPAVVVGTVTGANGPVQATFPIAGFAILLVGAAAGTFLAVDWALITDIIPKEATGRYMGISNVVTAMAGPIALFSGGIVAAVFNQVTFGLGARMAYLMAALFFVVAAILLRPVDQRRWEDVHGGTPAAAPAPADAAAPA